MSEMPICIRDIKKGPTEQSVLATSVLAPAARSGLGLFFGLSAAGVAVIASYPSPPRLV
jgi:hypothetical protein